LINHIISSSTGDFGLCSPEVYSAVSVSWKTVHRTSRQRLLGLLHGLAIGRCVWFWQVYASVIGKRGSSQCSVVDKTVGNNDWVTMRHPRGSAKTPLFLSPEEFWDLLPTSSIIHHLQHSRQQKKRKMSQSFSNNINSLNTTVNFTAVDERSNILAWLSPLEPRLRHKGIQESRVENVGEWVLETEEFKSWYTSSGGSGSDNAVLFCYGGPGVGKTFIRY